MMDRSSLLLSPSSSLLCQVIESRVVLLPPPSLPSLQITCSVAGTPPGHAVLDTKHLLVLCKLLAQHQRVSDLLPPPVGPSKLTVSGPDRAVTGQTVPLSCSSSPRFSVPSPLVLVLCQP